MAEQKPDPYPTPTRLKLARGIERGEVRHYPWAQPWTLWAPYDRKVTADVAVFVAPGLAEYGPQDAAGWQPVVLTDAGRAWLEAAERAT